MNKAEVITIVADKANVSKKATEEILDAFFNTVQDALASGEKVVLSGFGTFEVRNRVARTGRNPRTGEDISIPGQKSPAFKAGKVLKESVK
ncbi:MAG: HU family DNA-binding protein [Clostridium sp.]|nr:MAG: HU family DNA-binding protein [Clostridium sp.]